MEVDICHNKDWKVWCKEPKDQGIYLRPLVTLYGFLARWADSTISQVVLKKLFKNCTNRPPLSLSWMICKMKLPGKEDKTAVAVGTRTDDVCVRRCPNWRWTCCKWAAMPRAASSKLGARSLPLTCWPQTSPRTVAPSCSLVHARAERYTGISARSQESCTATPNPTCNSRARSWSGPEASGRALATKNQPHILPCYEKILDAKKKTPNFSQIFLTSLYSLWCLLQLSRCSSWRHLCLHFLN